MYRAAWFLAVLGVIAVGVPSPRGAHAISLVWSKMGAPGNWSDPGNWSPAQTPQPGDNLAFGAAGTADAINDLAADCQLANVSIGSGYPGVITMASPLLVGGTLAQPFGPSTIDFANQPWTVRGNVLVTSIVNPGLLTKSGSGSLSTNGASLTGGLRVSAGTTVLQEALSVTTLTVDPGAILDGGDQTISATSHVTLLMGSTYSYVPGASFVLGGGRLLTSGNSLRQVSVTGSVTALDPLSVDGNLQVTGGLKTNDVLHVPGTMVVSGTGVLELGDDAMVGNVSVVGAGALLSTGPAITFAAGSTTTIGPSATFRITGPTLRSSVPGTRYATTVAGTANTLLQGLDVQDSDASAGATLVAEPGIDSGNNLNWVFGAVVGSDVPRSMNGLALDGIRPNPSVREMVVSLSLADATAATLEVLDVAGRRLVMRAVGDLGRGRHVVPLRAERELSPGLYLVRLTQGGRSLTAKAVVVR